MTESTITDESRVSVSQEPTERIWTDGLVLLLHIALPIAITGAIIGRRAIFSRLWTHFDKSFIAVFCPSFSKREKLTKWMIEHLPNADGGLAAMWKDGSLMCTLINSAVPGACPNPHRHWRKPPLHGQALAFKYLGITPIFTEKDFGDGNQKPTALQEKQLIDYVFSLQAAIEKLTHNPDATYSTRYIARGMGLVTGEQHRKTEIYIYPNFKGQTLDDLLVNIRGPYNTYGSTVLKACSFAADKHAKLPDKRQSFLKSLSISNLLKPKDKGPACDIEIKTEFEAERTKLIFVPHNSGVYEICLTTNGEHISGSPFNLSIEKNRSGITQNLNDVKQEPVRKKVDRKKPLNAVIYYEKQLKEEEDGCKIDLIADVNYNTKQISKLATTAETKEPEKEHTIASYSNHEQKEKDQEELTLPILETLEQLNNLLESTEKLNLEEEIPPKRNNFGLNIIDTLREIPLLKRSESLNTESSLETKDSREFNQTTNFNLNETKPKSEVYSSLGCFESLGLEDSGTYMNDDMDPDSLSSSIELQGSSEEISLTGSSEGNDNEVNNNDVMVKSNEDICYLILNQNTSNSDNGHHERVYSKDFISCQDQDQGSRNEIQAGFSKSDPNLLNVAHSKTASVLSQDNIQEASQPMSSSMSSGIFPNHSQEDQKMKKNIGRSYSYSQGNLPDTEESLQQEGYEFKEHFLQRKAFWSNMSTSNVSISSVTEKKIETIQPNTENDRSHIKHVVVRTLARTESVRSLELRSRSLDYVRQRKKESVSRTASVDDLNFPSVRHRREIYLNEKTSSNSKSLEKSEKTELYAVRGEKYTWSIHDKIKSFETGPTSPNSQTPEKLSLPENIIITSKIKERFESAQTYFKQLETKPEDRRSSLSNQNFSSLRLNKTHIKTKDYSSLNGNINTYTHNGLQSLGTNNETELQAFFRKRKNLRTPLGDVFN